MTLLTNQPARHRLKVDIEKRSTDNRTGHISFNFRIGPFKKTMGTTVGAAIRRSLLSLSKTVAITSAVGNLHDGNCLREDLFELSLNLQSIKVKSSFFPYMGSGRILKKGPCIITGEDLLLEEGLKVVNPHQYICTLNDSYTLDLSLVISSPTMNQGISQIHPFKPFQFLKKKKFSSKSHQPNVDQSLKISNDSSSLETFEQNQTLESSKDSVKKVVPRSTSLVKKKKQKKTKNKKSSSVDFIPPPSAKKAPIDILVIDPIYSAIQSCSFELEQTTKSSVSEYQNLMEYGISNTEEFLQFVVVSRGSIEPVQAVEMAVKELITNLLVFKTLPHRFASEKNFLLSLQKATYKAKLSELRSNIERLYGEEILKQLDIRHLSFPARLELILRRQGIFTLEDLLSVHLSSLKKFNLNLEDVAIIQHSLKTYDFSIPYLNEIDWIFVPKF